MDSTEKKIAYNVISQGDSVYRSGWIFLNIWELMVQLFYTRKQTIDFENYF